MNDDERLQEALDQHGELLESDDGDVHLWLPVLDLDDMGIQKLGLVADYEWRLAQVPDTGPMGRWSDEAPGPEDGLPAPVLEKPSKNPKYRLQHLMGAMKFPLAEFRDRLVKRGEEVGLPNLAECFPYVPLVCAAFASPNSGWNGGAAEWSLELSPDAQILESATARRADLGRLPLSQEGRKKHEQRLDAVITRHSV